MFLCFSKQHSSFSWTIIFIEILQFCCFSCHHKIFEIQWFLNFYLVFIILFLQLLKSKSMSLSIHSSYLFNFFISKMKSLYRFANHKSLRLHSVATLSFDESINRFDVRNLVIIMLLSFIFIINVKVVLSKSFKVCLN